MRDNKPGGDPDNPRLALYLETGEMVRSMKSPQVLVLALACVCGSCASDDGPLVIVGRAGPRETAAPTTGRLIVETKTEMILDGDVPRYPHTGYRLLTQNGERIRYVWNRISDQDESPQVVSLAPGTYIVQPDGSRRSAIYEVTIAAGRTTILDLDKDE